MLNKLSFSQLNHNHEHIPAITHTKIASIIHLIPRAIRNYFRIRVHEKLRLSLRHNLRNLRQRNCRSRRLETRTKGRRGPTIPPRRLLRCAAGVIFFDIGTNAYWNGNCKTIMLMLGSSVGGSQIGPLSFRFESISDLEVVVTREPQ